MEMIRSKWMIGFVLVAFLFTTISSINSKKYDENVRMDENSYMYMNQIQEQI